MSEKAIQIINTTDFSTLGKMADIATSSGYVKVNKAQAMFIMLKGTELGISPLQALDGINIIQGKPTISPALMLALINRSSELQDIKIDSQDNECVVTMIRKNRSAHTERFSMDDARKMGLTGKDNYVKQAKTMLKWRAVSACARIVFPDVIQGVYTPEEMGAETIENDNGDVVITKDDAQPEIVTQVQIPATVQQPEPPPVVEEIKHDPNEWINGNIKAWGDKWMAKGMTAAQLMAALKITEKWTDFKGTVSEADAAVEAYRKPATLPPDVAAAKAASKPIDDAPKAEPAELTVEQLRIKELEAIHNEAATITEVEKGEFVKGKGLTSGFTFHATAYVDTAHGSQKIEFTLYPEDVAAIKAAGYSFPVSKGLVPQIPVILLTKDTGFKIRIDREHIEPAIPMDGKGKTSQEIFDEIPSEKSKQLVGMTVGE